MLVRHLDAHAAHVSGLSTRPAGRTGFRVLEAPAFQWDCRGRSVPAASHSAQLEKFDLDKIKQRFQEQGFAIVRGVVEESVRTGVQNELEALVRVNLTPAVAMLVCQSTSQKAAAFLT